MPEHIKVLLHDEKGVIFEGEASALSSVNEQGPFDVLFEHSNFITLIQERLTIHLPTGEEKKFMVDGGILRCFASEIEIYLGVKVQSQKPLPKQVY